MKETDIYKKLKSLADDLAKHQSYYSRADVAFELKSFGIQKDSIEVSKLIWEAYNHYQHDRNIAMVFISNNGRITIVEEYEIEACLENGDNEKAIDIATRNLNSSNETIQQVIDELKADITIALVKGGSIVTGTSQISNIQSEAESIYKAYAKLVNYYTNAEGTLKESINDFVAIRTYVHDIFVQYSSALVDIYGDAIKVVDPKLFDYNNIEYLDINTLLKQTELAFNSLTEKCGLLISEISDSFKQCYQTAIAGYKLADKSNKKLAMVMGGLELLSHYISTAEKATTMKSELTKLKSSVTHDTTLIKSDMGRLMVIYKTLNELYIPKADAFNRYSKQVLSEDMIAILDTLYQSPKAQEKRSERETLLSEYKAIEATINDHLNCINIYQNSIAELSSQIKATKNSYQTALSVKPNRPNIFSNICTLGSATNKYNRNIANWKESYGYIVTNYEEALTDLKIDQEELSNHQEALSQCKKEYLSKANQLNKINTELRKIVNASPELKAKMIQHLKPMIGLLNLAKEILESNLEQKLTTTVKINNYNQIQQLPLDLNNRLQQFTSMLANDLHITEEETNEYLDSFNHTTQPCETNEKETTKKENLQLRTDINQAQNQVIEQGINLFNHWMKLQTQCTEFHLVKEQYQAEFNHIKDSFKQQMNQINDKSTYLREVLKKINTAPNNQILKEALIQLCDLNENQLSDNDFQDFINGKRTINL